MTWSECSIRAERGRWERAQPSMLVKVFGCTLFALISALLCDARADRSRPKEASGALMPIAVVIRVSNADAVPKESVCPDCTLYAPTAEFQQSLTEGIRDRNVFQLILDGPLDKSELLRSLREHGLKKYGSLIVKCSLIENDSTDELHVFLTATLIVSDNFGQPNHYQVSEILSKDDLESPGEKGPEVLEGVLDQLVQQLKTDLELSRKIARAAEIPSTAGESKNLGKRGAKAKPKARQAPSRDETDSLAP